MKQVNYWKSLVIFGLFLGFNSLSAQILDIKTDTYFWECKYQAGLNFNPLSYAVANGGTWGAPVTGSVPDWPNLCLNPDFNFLGMQAITTPGNADCDPVGNFTSFFRRNFTLYNNNQFCGAKVIVMADDFFRLYVDGNLVPASFAAILPPIPITPNDGDAYCTGGYWAATNVTGDSRLRTYSIDISSFINTMAANHSVLFEVGNCTYLNYLAANILIEQVPNPVINFDLDCPNTLTLWGAQGIPNQTWTLFSGSSSNGPWVQYQSHVDPNAKAAKFPFVSTVPQEEYIRIEHSISFICNGMSDVISTELVIQGCFQFNGSGDDRSQPDKPVLGSQQNLLDVFPNPASAFIQVRLNSEKVTKLSLVNTMGGKVLDQLVNETAIDLPCEHLSDGIYFLLGTDDSGHILVNKKVVIQHHY